MTEPVHTVHDVLWNRLKAVDPTDVCLRSGAGFDPVSHTYFVRFLNRYYCMNAQERVCGALVPGSVSNPSSELVVALLTYLMSAQSVGLKQKLVAPSDLQGGKTFFGSHRLPTDAILERFGRDPRGFVSAGSALGGTPESYGDASVRFWLLERVPVVMVLWAADDEFPARCSVLFDASVDKIVPLDALCGLVGELCRWLTI